jgi:hydroxyacyl-ACP dehydratase HTD2-like protein with hotdog domain
MNITVKVIGLLLAIIIAPFILLILRYLSSINDNANYSRKLAFRVYASLFCNKNFNFNNSIKFKVNTKYFKSFI